MFLLAADQCAGLRIDIVVATFAAVSGPLDSVVGATAALFTLTVEVVAGTRQALHDADGL